ncbi:hypothetical protein FACS1894151_09090 [Spirochaetia bacterium]|nr:hypothetical protein FACS1894151_09090 [Spirochaetia bacterium]
MSDSDIDPSDRDPSENALNTFAVFGLSVPLLSALKRKGFEAPTSIQNSALPRLLAEEGRLIVKARTGTGKTAAFGIPLVERYVRGVYVPGHAPRALILTPTRELALQISREIASFIPQSVDFKSGDSNSGDSQGESVRLSRAMPRIAAVYGGASIRSQIIDLKRGVEIVVGTPGRIIDLMDRKVLELQGISWFILDEADEMLDMGFIEDVEKILAAAKQNDPRIVMFSATMPEGIRKIVREYIGEAEILEDAPPTDDKPLVDQYYLLLRREDRLEALRRIIDAAPEFYALVFCQTKVETDEIARRLVEGGYPAEAIHGDLSQEARERTLRRFRSKLTTILVATDVAARGLDIERLTHVINFDLPHDRETYIHRIGRTGRAGRRGLAISLALPAEREKMSRLSRNIEHVLGSKINWTKVPTVKSVMKSLRRRIVNGVIESLPEDELETKLDLDSAAKMAPGATLASEEQSVLTNPYAAKVSRELIESLGAERAVEALIMRHYGEQLDPARYGEITEIPEFSSHDSYGKGAAYRDRRGSPGGYAGGGRGNQEYGRFQERAHAGGGHTGAVHSANVYSANAHSSNAHSFPAGKPRRSRSEDEDRFPRDRNSLAGDEGRLYVGLGKQHGASAREIAALLGRIAGVPGRLVDAIEVRDYCSFATLPPDAARRACSYSQNAKDGPSIRPASQRGNRG